MFLQNTCVHLDVTAAVTAIYSPVHLGEALFCEIWHFMAVKIPVQVFSANKPSWKVQPRRHTEALYALEIQYILSSG